jgi:hypothetical protein
LSLEPTSRHAQDQPQQTLVEAELSRFGANGLNSSEVLQRYGPRLCAHSPLTFAGDHELNWSFRRRRVLILGERGGAEVARPLLLSPQSSGVSRQILPLGPCPLFPSKADISRVPDFVADREAATPPGGVPVVEDFPSQFGPLWAGTSVPLNPLRSSQRTSVMASTDLGRHRGVFPAHSVAAPESRIRCA